MILENAPDALALKNLLLACPPIYPIYCRHRYKVLFRVLPKSMSRITAVWATVLLDIHKLDKKKWYCRDKARRRLIAGHRMIWNQVPTNFCIMVPSLPDLVEIFKAHCWVMQKAQEYSRAATEPNIVHYWTQTDATQNLSTFLYLIEIFAFLVGETDRGWAAASLPRSGWQRDRGWAAASLPKSGWERDLLKMWNPDEIKAMSQIVRVLWPNIHVGTPPYRRRTRVLLVRSARTGQWKYPLFLFCRSQAGEY